MVYFGWPKSHTHRYTLEEPEAAEQVRTCANEGGACLLPSQKLWATAHCGAAEEPLREHAALSSGDAESGVGRGHKARAAHPPRPWSLFPCTEDSTHCKRYRLLMYPEPLRFARAKESTNLLTAGD